MSTKLDCRSSTTRGLEGREMTMDGVVGEADATSMELGGIWCFVVESGRSTDEDMDEASPRAALTGDPCPSFCTGITASPLTCTASSQSLTTTFSSFSSPPSDSLCRAIWVGLTAACDAMSSPSSSISRVGGTPSVVKAALLSTEEVMECQDGLLLCEGVQGASGCDSIMDRAETC